MQHTDKAHCCLWGKRGHVLWDLCKSQWPQTVQCLAKDEIEWMEEYLEAKIYKSKPELRNSNLNADNFFFSISGNDNCCQWHGVCL